PLAPGPRSASTTPQGQTPRHPPHQPRRPQILRQVVRAQPPAEHQQVLARHSLKLDNRPDSLRPEGAFRPQQEVVAIRRTSPRAPRKARSRARIRTSRKSQRKVIRNSCRLAVMAATAEPAVAEWVRL